MKFKVSYTYTYLTITTSSFCVCSMFSITSQERTYIIEHKFLPALKKGTQDYADSSRTVVRFILKNTTFCSTHLCSFGYHLQFYWFQEKHPATARCLEKEMTRITICLKTIIYKETGRVHLEKSEGTHHI